MAASAPLRIPLLMGGISLQPPSVRFPHQVEDSQNVQCSVLDGSSKRSGTWLLRMLCGDTMPTDDVRLHPIDRDGSERYLVLYGAGVLRVVPIAGAEATVNISADAQAYLDMNGATSDQLRLITIADYTLIVNTTVPVASTAAASFSITDSWYDYDRMIAHTPSDDTYHQVLNDTAEHEAGYYHYKVIGVPTAGDTGTFAKRVFKTVTGFSYAAVDGAYNDAGASFGFGICFRKKAMVLTAVTFTFATLRLTKVGAFATYTWQDGDHIQINSGTGITPGFYEIVAKVSDDAITLATAPAGADNADTATDGICTRHSVVVPTANFADMYAVAQAIQDGLEEAGATHALCEWFEEGYQTGHFVITSPYRGADTYVNVTFPADGAPLGFGDLAQTGASFEGVDSPVAANGTGTGALTLTPDDRWTRVPGPGEVDAIIDPTLMPVKMIRSSVGPPAVFNVDVIDWNDRASGDAFSNPTPSLWQNNRTISDIAFIRDRLSLLGWENFVASQSGDAFNFYVEDADNIVASDPIDLPMSSNQVTIIDYAVPFRDGLTVFTLAGRQFQISAPETFSADTVVITATTSYETLPVRPRAMGQFLYFLGRLGCNSQLLEYNFDSVSVASDATDVSEHVRGLIPVDIRSMDTNQNLRTVLILPTDSNEVIVYIAFWNGQRKEQSAWTRYIFDESYNIRDIAVIGSQCYMLIKRSDVYTIESFHLSQEDEDCPAPTFYTCPAVGGSSGSGSSGGSSGSGSGSGAGSPEPGTPSGASPVGCGGAGGCGTTGTCIEAMNCDLCPATSGGSPLCGCYTVDFGTCCPGGNAGPCNCRGGSVAIYTADFCCYTGTTVMLSESTPGASTDPIGTCNASLSGEGCWRPCGLL